MVIIPSNVFSIVAILNAWTSSYIFGLHEMIRPVLMRFAFCPNAEYFIER